MSTRWPRMLNYHAIVELGEDPNRTGTSPGRFESHMRALKRRNMRGVSVSELLRAWRTGDSKGLVGLAFDDGYRDFLHTAMPILERYGFSATVFVVAGMLGKENDWAHWYDPRPRLGLLESADLREISAQGIEIGSHSMTHPKLPGLDSEDLEREVDGSRQLLGGLLGETVEGFCYPYGLLDEASVEEVRRAGYSYACAVNSRVEHSIYDLSRVPISDLDNSLRFAAKLSVHPYYRKVKTSYLRILGRSEEV